MKESAAGLPVGVLLSLLVALPVIGCDSLEPIAPPAAAVTEDDPLVALLVERGFRRGDIEDAGDHFVVERDMIIMKDAITSSRDREPPVPVRPEEGGLIPEQWRTDDIVAIDYAERVVVDLSHLDANSTAWASAARQAMQDWNGTPGWLRFVEGSPGDIRIEANDLGYQGPLGIAVFPIDAPVTGKPGHLIQVNSNGSFSASLRRLTVAHELGHTVGLRHTDWQSRGEDQSPEHTRVGASLIPGTPETDAASVMNGSPPPSGGWEGFSYYDLIAIERLYPPPNVSGPGFISSAGSYTWRVHAASGAPETVWTRKNVSGYTEPYVVGHGPTLTISVSAGSSFTLYAESIIGLAGQTTADLQYVNNGIPGGCTFC